MAYDQMVESLRALLKGKRPAYQPFLVLSDEEIAVLDRGERSELIVQPWIEAQPEVSQSLAMKFGERSLFLRGLVTGEETPAEDVLRASDDLELAADARRVGCAFVRATSRHGGVTTAHISALQPAVGGFEETVDEEGLHIFSACSYERIAARTAEWAADVPDAGGGDARGEIPAHSWSTLVVDEFDVDVRTVDIAFVHPGTEGTPVEEHWVVAHDRERAILGVPTDQEGDRLRVTTITPDDLRESMAYRIRAALGHR